MTSHLLVHLSLLCLCTTAEWSINPPLAKMGLPNQVDHNCCLTLIMTHVLFIDQSVWVFISPLENCHNIIEAIFWFVILDFLVRSLVSPLLYWINCVNLPVGSSVYILTDSLNIDIKYVYSRVYPSNGFKSTCGADCSFTNLLNFANLLFCFVAILYNGLCFHDWPLFHHQCCK